MHLENRNPNKRNTKVTVRGTTYWIGHGGFIDNPEDPGNPIDVSDEHAALLLQGKAWRELTWDPSDPRYAKRMMPAPQGKGLGRRPRTKDELQWDQGIRPKSSDEIGGQVVTAATKTGEPTGKEMVEKKPPSDEELAKAHEQTEAEVSASNAKELEQDTGLLSDMGEPVSGTDTTQEIEAATTSSPASEWKIPEGDEEWPDPKEDMPIEYLREMAKAYEVPFSSNTKEKRLVQDLTKAMYE